MRFLWTAAALYVAVTLQGSKACTTLVVGKKASKDGSVMATHSNDGEGATDPRLVRVPARDWPAGSMRPIMPVRREYGATFPTRLDEIRT